MSASSAAQEQSPGPAVAAGSRRVRAFEPGAVAAVMLRELTVFGRSWRGTTFTALTEPAVYLIGFGFGLGAIIEEVLGVEYLDFVGTGIVASAVLFSSALPAMYTTFVKRRFQRVYDAILATPIDVREIVVGEVLWLAIRAGLYGVAPLLITMLFGLDPQPAMLLVPLIGFLTGLGFASFGVVVSARANAIDRFNNVSSGVLTPLVILAGVFFPISRLPDWVEVLAWLDPLYHTVELVRGTAFGFEGLVDLAHVGLLMLFAAIMLPLAINQLRPRLID
jgi:lipooligosaccharide transport system permease protein